jgi:starvation-inducible outer membrane lipoprotein
MTQDARLLFWYACAALVISTTLALSGCSNLPRHYVRMAEPDTTFTMLKAHPEKYEGKVVLLGGTIIEEEANDQYLWLRVNNRPLDQDYMPHRPLTQDGPEAGSYWLMVGKDKLPPSYKHWARMTVVGRVLGGQQHTEPVLSLLYVRGWGVSGTYAGIWERLDPDYVPTLPAGAGGGRP